MIGIIDYGMGNIHSVQNTLRRLGIDHFLSGSMDELDSADALLLPGVGAFKDAMHTLKRTGMDEFIIKKAKVGTPVLGICLGMQLLFEESEENGLTEGLGLLPGRVVRFSGESEDGETYKVPHMGWNELLIKDTRSPLLKDLPKNHVYFVHSYFVKTAEQDVLHATADYYEEVPAVVGRAAVFGTQFHPEKSSEAGLKMLSNFSNYVKER